MDKNNNEYNGLDKDKKELLKSLMGAASSKEVDFNKILESWEEDSIFNRDTELTEEGLDNLISQMKRAKKMPKHTSNIDIEENMREGKKALDRFLKNRNRAFMVSEDKSEEFKELKPNKEHLDIIMKRVKKLNIQSIPNINKCDWNVIELMIKKAIEDGMTKKEVSQKIDKILGYNAERNLEDRYINKYKEALKKMSKEELSNIEKLLEEE